MDRHTKRLLFGVLATLAAFAALAVGFLFANRPGAGLLWLGPGPGLHAQVAARLQPTGKVPLYGSADAEDVASMYLQPLKAVRDVQILSVRTENLFPLWASALDDDPVYALQVDLEVEYASGARTRLRWSTWGYGLVIGPAVIRYGSGPPGELSRLPE